MRVLSETINLGPQWKLIDASLQHKTIDIVTI